METSMKTLWSVSVFGLLPIPATDRSRGHDDVLHAEDLDRLRRMFDRRKTMATAEEIERILAELKKAEARSRDTRSSHH
jgi:hypothetical protein